MMEVVNLFREKGTLDELGIGTIRDTFAERLFPGQAQFRRVPGTSCSSPGSTRNRARAHTVGAGRTTHGDSRDDWSRVFRQAEKGRAWSDRH